MIATQQLYWLFLVLVVLALVLIIALIVYLLMRSAKAKNASQLLNHNEDKRQLADDKRQTQDTATENELPLVDSREQALIDQMQRVGRQAVDQSLGDPYQSEMSFVAAEEYASWEDAVKMSFARRMGRSKQVAKAASVSQPRPKTDFLLLYVMAPRSKSFNGRDILNVLRKQGMAINKDKVFEALDPQGTLFYATSCVPPGSFDMEKLHLVQTPGVNFIIDLQKSANPTRAFKKMLQVMDAMAKALDGDLLNDKRQRLTQASLAEYYARIRGIAQLRMHS